MTTPRAPRLLRCSQPGGFRRACAVAALLAFGHAPVLHAQQPIPQSPPAKLDGHTLFTEKGCAHCHGPEALGTGDGPDLHGLGKRLTPDAMRAQILNGGKSMPAFSDALTPEETDSLIAWVRSLRPPPKTRRR